MANDICARITFQVLARDNFFVMKQLKIDEGKTDLRFYFSQLFLNISNSHQYKLSNHQKAQRKSEKQMPAKEHLRLGRKF